MSRADWIKLVAVEELSDWVEQRGSAGIADNVRCALTTGCKPGVHQHRITELSTFGRHVPDSRLEQVKPTSQRDTVEKRIGVTIAVIRTGRERMQLEVSGNWIFGEGIRFEVEYPALEAVLINGRVLVTFDWMAFERNAPAQNLFCYDSSGNLLWRAPAIGMGAVDAYTGVTNEKPLWVGNFSGFNCRIDETSGQVLETCFTK